jgi:hypothetical protein
VLAGLHVDSRVGPQLVAGNLDFLGGTFLAQRRSGGGRRVLTNELRAEAVRRSNQERQSDRAK